MIAPLGLIGPVYCFIRMVAPLGLIASGMLVYKDDRPFGAEVSFEDYLLN